MDVNKRSGEHSVPALANWPSLDSPSLPWPSMKAQAAEGAQSHHLRPMRGAQKGSGDLPVPLDTSHSKQGRWLKRNPQGLRQTLPRHSGCQGAWLRPGCQKPQGEPGLRASPVVSLCPSGAAAKTTTMKFSEWQRPWQPNGFGYFGRKRNQARQAVSL